MSLTYRPAKGIRFGTYVNPSNLDISNTIDNLYDFNSWIWLTQSYVLITLNNGLRFKVDHIYQSPFSFQLISSTLYPIRQD